MNKYDIMRLAQIYLMAAKMESVKAKIAGMQADNSERLSAGCDPIWPGYYFEEAEVELTSIAAQLEAIVGMREGKKNNAT